MPKRCTVEALYISIGVLVLASLLIYSLTSRSAGWLRTAQLIFYAAVVLISTIVYYDAAKLNERFFTADNTIMLEEQQQLYAGIRGRVSQTPEAILQPELGQYQDLRSNGAYDALRGQSYKLFLFDVGAFWSIAGPVQFGDTLLTREEAILVLRSPNSLVDFANLVIAQRRPADPDAARAAIVRRFTSAEELKAKLFSALLAQAKLEQEKSFVPNSYRSHTLIVAPRSPYFLFLEYAPQFLVDLVVQRG